MENLQDKIARLLASAEWSPEDKRWLLEYLENSDGEALQQLMHRYVEEESEAKNDLDASTRDLMLEKIHDGIGMETYQPKRLVAKIAIRMLVAASLLGCVVLGFITLSHNNSVVPVTTAPVPAAIKDSIIQPGGNKAILTLADGTRITLDDQQNGTLANQGTSRVIKLDGKILYHGEPQGNQVVVYNTITTPVGGQYQVGLPDGSTVWLNASSSLRFPTSFTGKERRVEVSGEAFFDISRNEAMPFKVEVSGSEIQVLGTEFNVMAYEDEAAMKTTLLKGVIKFYHAGSNLLLKPRQQTQVTKDGRVSLLSNVDVDEVVAWKNGMFDFEGADIRGVARQLSRWFDVDMEFDRRIDEIFHAQIPRDTKLQDVLKALELTGRVKFIVTGRKIIARSGR